MLAVDLFPALELLAAGPAVPVVRLTATREIRTAEDGERSWLPCVRLEVTTFAAAMALATAWDIKEFTAAPIIQEGVAVRFWRGALSVHRSAVAHWFCLEIVASEEVATDHTDGVA